NVVTAQVSHAWAGLEDSRTAPTRPRIVARVLARENHGACWILIQGLALTWSIVRSASHALALVNAMQHRQNIAHGCNREMNVRVSLLDRAISRAGWCRCL